MNRDRRRRNRFIKLILTEFFMVVAIIGVVGIAMFAVSGYHVSGDFEIEQGGMVQFISTPTGAHVLVDGEQVSGRTEFSRMLDAGEHDITVFRDGYDTWSRRITVRPGYLLRLTYPRLFKTERTAEEVEKVTKLRWLSASPSREMLLYSTDTTTKWTVMNIRGDKVVTSTLDVAGIFSGTGGGRFPGKIKEMRWNKNGDKVLMLVENGKKEEWGLVNVRKVANSVNLTKEFDMAFSSVVFMDDAAEGLFTVTDGKLRQVDLSSKKISKVLVSGVTEVAADGREVIFVTSTAKDGSRVVGLMREGDKGSVKVATVSSNDAKATVHVGLSDYLGDNYLFYTVGKQVRVLKVRNLPSYGEKLEAKEVLNKALSYVSASVEVSRGKEYVLFRQGKKVAAFEAETDTLAVYDSLSSRSRWIDDSLMYDAFDDEEGLRRLVVWDFDGENVRWLSGVDGRFDVAITANDRWLYYVKGGVITRERLN